MHLIQPGESKSYWQIYAEIKMRMAEGVSAVATEPTFPCGRKRAKYGSQQINPEPQDHLRERRVLLKKKRKKKDKRFHFPF